MSLGYLDSSVLYDHPRLYLPSYRLVWAYSLSHNDRGGVGIYFKESLAVWPVPISSLKECLLLEGDTLCIITVLGLTLEIWNRYSSNKLSFIWKSYSIQTKWGVICYKWTSDSKVINIWKLKKMRKIRTNYMAALL